MKKVLVLLLTLTLTLSLSFSAFAGSDKGNNGKGNGKNKSEVQTTSTSGSDVSATSIWSNKTGNLVKLYTEDGKKVMFPVQALMNHGATEVDWDGNTVTVTGPNGTSVVFTPNSTTATTKATVTMGELTYSLLSDTITDAATGAGNVTGTMQCNITDPITRALIPVTLSVTGTSTSPTGAGLDRQITGTMTGTYTDPATEQMITITGTVAGSVLSPDYTLDTDSQSIDFAIPFENQISNGRAYVPIQDLDKLFATQFEEPVEPTV